MPHELVGDVAGAAQRKTHRHLLQRREMTKFNEALRKVHLFFPALRHPTLVAIAGHGIDEPDRVTRHETHKNGGLHQKNIPLFHVYLLHDGV